MHIAVILSTLLPVALCCPSAESLHPCVCEGDDIIEEVTCYGLENEIDLQNAAAACRNRPLIRNFKIIHSVLNYIPYATFKDTLFKTLEISDTTLVSIGEKDEAFVGLENTLNTLALSKNIFMGSWDWSDLKNLKSLKFLKFSEMELQSIDKDIENINFLIGIDLSKNKILWIHDEAFVYFQSLVYLFLVENDIKILKRSMFPNPASSLQTISLRQNQIQTLPIDMFQNMPKLDTFLISGNHILTLDERTYSAAWNQLAFIDLDDNDLRCDCRMSWIIKTRLPRTTIGFCSEPPELKGKNLTKLTGKDLWC
ncbi:peroxidasin-like isoform X2 [Stegodyphus dumicola]|uniref:peroxidasin-like isoform X2 n=1 Tax=Stegodyphus dumicola TaxID=202533 RepID=UPI0015A80E60|nr:peroxidasin-like isoform X2 [Stegodyphus dumicola]